MQNLLEEIRKCRICEAHLVHGPRPVMAADPKSKIVIIGQAPGARVHESGIPWDDKSGENLRDWLGVGKDQFYDPELFALLPMGFCFPGKGRSGDLPPRPECAPLWHDKLLDQMKDVKLTLLIGQYAQKKYLGTNIKRSLTETVRSFSEYLPEFFVLPHPSPRNNIWRAKNPWFDQQVIPALRIKVAKALNA